MKHIWSVLCRQSIIDNNTNNISLIDVLEGIQVDLASVPEGGIGKKIKIPVSFEIVSFYENFNPNKELRFKSKIDLVAPGDIIIPGKESEVILPIGPKRLRQRTRINGLPITVDGSYKLRVLVKQENEDYKTVAELPLDITINIQKNLIPEQK